MYSGKIAVPPGGGGFRKIIILNSMNVPNETETTRTELLMNYFLEFHLM
jgi:hypothetical protein